MKHELGIKKFDTVSGSSLMGACGCGDWWQKLSVVLEPRDDKSEVEVARREIERGFLAHQG